MTIETFDKILKYLVNNSENYRDIHHIEDHLNATSETPFKTLQVLLSVQQLIREGLVCSERAIITDRDGKTKQITDRYEKPYYYISWKGIEVTNAGGYTKFLEERKAIETLELEKKKQELDFVTKSSEMIPFQRKQGWLTLFVSVLSLIFIAVTTYQGCNDDQVKELNGIKLELQKLKEATPKVKESSQELTPVSPPLVKKDSILPKRKEKK